jgi:hypothetical protein
MSRYLQVTPKMEGVTFDQMIKPFLLYKDEYDRQQDTYDKLLEDTLVLEGLKDSTVDSELYGKYSEWRTALNNAADTLSNTGKLDMQTARDLRRKYINDFKPMEDRYKHRNTLIASQAAKASPTVIYDRDFSSMPVSDISLDDSVRFLDLTAIEKQAYDDATSRYIDDGMPEDLASDVNRIMSGIDTEGYSEDAVNRVRDSITKGLSKASNAIDEYKVTQEAKDLQLKLSKKSLDKPYNTDSSTKTPSQTITDEVTNRKIKVYPKGGKVYIDQAHTKEYVPGESTITNIDRDKYAGLSGTYEYSDYHESFKAGAGASGSKTSMNSITDYQNFIRGGGSEKAREALAKFISEKKIDPYVMYASGVVFNMYENDGQYYIEVGKKPATAPPGA